MDKSTIYCSYAMPTRSAPSGHVPQTAACEICDDSTGTYVLISLMTFPDKSIAFIFSTRRARVSSFFASEYQTTNSFLWLNDKQFSFSVSFAPQCAP
jgi:hypothetical protein